MGFYQCSWYRFSDIEKVAISTLGLTAPLEVLIVWNGYGVVRCAIISYDAVITVKSLKSLKGDTLNFL